MSEATAFPRACEAKYRPERPLGSGAYGCVWLARQVGLDRPVAFKCLHPHALENEDQRGRFDAEAKITAELAHPHVVVVLDHGDADGVPWIAYEYLPGESLRARLAKGPLRWRDAVSAAAQVAAALQAAHERGIIHRDIKPDNVIEAAPDTWKVADFGIARWTGTERVKTASGLILGTPAYIAPEEVTTGTVSPACDIYALGAMLHELLTGEVPYPADDAVAMLRRHVNDAPPRVTAKVRALPTALDDLVLRALSKDPALRPDAARMRRELEAALAVQPARRKGSTASIPVAPPRPGPHRSAWALIAVAVLAPAAFFAFRARPSPAPGPAPAPISIAAPASPSPAGLSALVRELASIARPLPALRRQIEEILDNRPTKGALGFSYDGAEDELEKVENGYNEDAAHFDEIARHPAQLAALRRGLLPLAARQAEVAVVWSLPDPPPAAIQLALYYGYETCWVCGNLGEAKLRKTVNDGVLETIRTSRQDSYARMYFATRRSKHYAVRSSREKANQYWRETGRNAREALARLERHVASGNDLGAATARIPILYEIHEAEKNLDARSPEAIAARAQLEAARSAPYAGPPELAWFHAEMCRVYTPDSGDAIKARKAQ